MTPLQDQLLTYLRRRNEQPGPMPTVREMQAALGLNSVSQAHRLLMMLVDRGWVRCRANRARSYELVGGRMTAAELDRAYCAAHAIWRTPQNTAGSARGAITQAASQHAEWVGEHVRSVTRG